MGKIERQELDRRRQVLAEIDGTIAELERRHREMREQFATEMRQGWDLPDGPRLVAAWAPAHHWRTKNLELQKEQLRELRAEQVAAVVTQHVEVRRIETLEERARDAERTEQARKEMAVIDELAVIRHRPPTA